MEILRYNYAKLSCLGVIRRYAHAIAEEFRPDKIILFGSYAWGTPNKDSDVDLLIITPAYDQHTQAVRILWRLAAPFPVDLIVRTPKEMKWRLAEGESFTTAIVSQGKVLYEKGHARVGEVGRSSGSWLLRIDHRHSLCPSSRKQS
jgi:predicted nucleotidyltransferase